METLESAIAECQSLALDKMRAILEDCSYGSTFDLAVTQISDIIRITPVHWKLQRMIHRQLKQIENYRRVGEV